LRSLKEYQNLIAGLSLALSIFTAAGAVFGLVFRIGQAVAQHEQIIEAQGQMMRVLNEKCR
jgi:hypothetical protein